MLFWSRKQTPKRHGHVITIPDHELFRCREWLCLRHSSSQAEHSLLAQLGELTVYTVSKQRPKSLFCNISYETWGDADEIWYTVSWINLLQNDVHVFHYAWIT